VTDKNIDMSKRIVDFIVANIESFNLADVSRACGIDRSKMQRRIIQGNWKDSEIQALETYFKNIRDGINEVFNEGK
jgi:hypothetical protein